METWILIAIGVAVVLGIAVGWALTKRRRLPAAPPAEKVAPATKQAEAAPKLVVVPEPSRTVTPEEQLAGKLSKTRSSFLGKLEKFFGRSQGNELAAQEWESVEEALLEADVGITTTTALVNKVRGRLKEENNTRSIRDLMVEESRELLRSSSAAPFNLEGKPKPYVISIVGVNGVGKTTTIGKLAHHFKSEGKTVLLGAADTFRAAAISQLRIWADRVGADFVTGREGADPGAVAFDAATASKARNIDVMLLDTAGRLHTKVNLMDELKKVIRVIKKVIPEAPHETWLVVDGTLGQNSIQQAKEFKKTMDLTGVIVTKLDGTAKGGAMLAVSSELGLPVRFIGVGEAMEDLIPFSADQFVAAILG